MRKRPTVGMPLALPLTSSLANASTRRSRVPSSWRTLVAPEKPSARAKVGDVFNARTASIMLTRPSPDLSAASKIARSSVASSVAASRVTTAKARWPGRGRAGVHDAESVRAQTTIAAKMALAAGVPFSDL